MSVKAMPKAVSNAYYFECYFVVMKEFILSASMGELTIGPNEPAKKPFKATCQAGRPSFWYCGWRSSSDRRMV